MTLEKFDKLDKVKHGARKPVDLIDRNDIDLSG